MRTEIITSAQNSKIKLLLELQEKSKTRKKEGLFVVEGRRELLHCIEAGYIPHTVFFCPEIISEGDKAEITQAIEKQNAEGKMPMAIEVPQQLYDKIAYRGGTEGVVAEMYCKDLSLNSLKLKENPLIVVLESVEKPGNLGAVLRSADASGVDAVIVCDPLTDKYNPNLIRSSIGAILPRTIMLPSVGLKIPESTLSIVDFPEPEEPMIATNSPSSIESDTPSNACTGSSPMA
jgi:TrmH family RNA methyltransferase